jgi:hypothetical protein
MPYKIRKYKNKKTDEICFSVVNTETKKVHSKCTDETKAKRQKRLLESLEGAGFKENVDKFLQTIKNVSFSKRKAGLLPPKSRKLLEEIKDETITSLEIVRTPIESYINKTLSLVSLGSWNNAIRSSGYDKLFHLSLFINKKYVFHKIEVTTLARENPIKKDSEVMDASNVLVKISNTGIPLSINTMIENTKKFMGDEKFTSYDPVNNNCQDFLLGVFKGNNISTPEIEKFIKQDAEAIFQKTPQLTSMVARFVTDLGSRFNRLVEGEGGSIQVQNILKYLEKQKKNNENLQQKTEKIKNLTQGNGKNKTQKNKWIEALKIYNKGKKWSVPAKNTEEYKKVKIIMEKL